MIGARSVGAEVRVGVRVEIPLIPRVLGEGEGLGRLPIAARSSEHMASTYVLKSKSSDLHRRSTPESSQLPSTCEAPARRMPRSAVPIVIVCPQLSW